MCLLLCRCCCLGGSFPLNLTFSARNRSLPDPRVKEYGQFRAPNLVVVLHFSRELASAHGIA